MHGAPAVAVGIDAHGMAHLHRRVVVVETRDPAFGAPVAGVDPCGEGCEDEGYGGEFHGGWR